MESASENKEPEWEKDYVGEDDDIYDAVIQTADSKFKRSAVFGKMRAKITSLQEQLAQRELNPVEREMLALSIFTMSMKIGPASFDNFESIAKKTDVTKEFVANAVSWIAYNKSNEKEK